MAKGHYKWAADILLKVQAVGGSPMGLKGGVGLFWKKEEKSPAKGLEPSTINLKG